MVAETKSFVHLRVRSAYSLLEGAIKADAIGKLSAAGDMPAVALTDRANLFGALEFSVTTKDAGVQPIIGCALPVNEHFVSVTVILCAATGRTSSNSSMSKAKRRIIVPP